MEEQETVTQPTPEPAEPVEQTDKRPFKKKKPRKKINKKKILAVLGAIFLLLFIAFLDFTGTVCIQHKWAGADCDQPRHCVKCGETQGKIDPDDHSWNEADCESPRTCADCGLAKGEKNPDNHAWDDATCMAPMTCWKCGETRGEPAAQHLWQSDGTCEWCGISQGITEPANDQGSTSSVSEETASETDSSSDSNERLSDEELEEVALQALYSHLVSLEGKYNQFEADYSRYEVATIERDGSGGVEVYGRVAFYDKHGSAVAFGGDYQRNFTVHTTEWGTTAWCEM